MKRQIRKSVFETNSSSTHSICISKAPVTTGKEIDFYTDEYGWENDCVYDTASYLYTAILEMHDSEELLEKLKDILDRNAIKYEFHTPSKYDWYIDHAYDTREFVEAVLEDEDMLMRYLFGNSCIYTGNDNQDCCPAGCDIAKETMWEYEGDKYITKPNPYHDSEHYDYFLKEN